MGGSKAGERRGRWRLTVAKERQGIGLPTRRVAYEILDKLLCLCSNPLNSRRHGGVHKYAAMHTKQ
jgi:hypothetical protein